MTIAKHFIVGMPRSGTTWLGRNLAAHPDVAVFGETDYWARSYVHPEKDGHYGYRGRARVKRLQRLKDWARTTGDENGALPGLPEGAYGEIAARALDGLAGFIAPVEVFEAIMNLVARTLDRPVVIEKTPGHLIYLEQFIDHFPDARLIVTWREPVGFVVSLRHEQDRKHGRAMAWLIRFSRHPFLAAMMWQSYNRALERANKRWSDRILLIRLDDIVEDGPLVLSRVQTHLGLGNKIALPKLNVVNSSFTRNKARQPEAVIRFWVKVVTGRDALRQDDIPAIHMGTTCSIVGSVLMLPLSLIVFAGLMWRSVRNPFEYMLAFFGFRTPLDKDRS